MSRAHLLMLLLLFTISLTGCYTTFFADDDLYSSSSSRIERTESSETTIVIDEYFAPAPYFGTSWLWGSFWYDPWFDPFFASPWAPVSVGWWSPYWRWSWGWSPYWAWSGWGWQPGWSWAAPYPSPWIWVPTAPTAQAPLLRSVRPFGRLRSVPSENDGATPMPQTITAPVPSIAPNASDTRRISSSSEHNAPPSTPATEKRTRPAAPNTSVLPYRDSNAPPAYRTSPSPSFGGERRIQSISPNTGSSYSGSGAPSGTSSGSGSSGARSSGRSRN